MHNSSPPLHESVNFDDYQPQDDKLQQMESETEGWKKLTGDWRSKILTPDKYQTQKEKRHQLLSEYEDIWSEHLGRIDMARSIVERESKPKRPVHCALYHAGPIARQFAAKEFQEML